MLTLPDSENSLWIDTAKTTKYPALEKDVPVDVVIIGGGITGLTSAYLLKQAGLSVAVLEKSKIGSGTTGHTTAKVTAQHGLVYDELSNRLGEKTARTYGEANLAVIKQIEKIVKKEKINCGWRRADNYVFTADPAQVAKFKAEAKTAAGLGLPATYETDLALPFKTEGAVKFARQAWLHPQHYLLGLAKAIRRRGSFVFENSRVISIHDGEPCVVRTKDAQVFAKDIIVATNVPTFPLLARGSYCMMEYPHKSYLVAGSIGYKLPGMYISPDKEHYSILPLSLENGHVLLIGGENHIPGLGGRVKPHHQNLADYAEEKFGATNITHRWSARDYMAYDDLPLVGKVYPWSKHLYTATAFRKWGMTNTTVSAMILRDLIIGRQNPWASTFNALRPGPITSIPRVFAQKILP